jgi:tetratricopeptide (TPR) repeat protein
MNASAREPADILLAEFAAEAARTGDVAALALLHLRLVNPPAPLQLWIDLAAGLLRSGFAFAAAELAGSALRHFPQNAQLHYWRGNALRVSGQLADAERELRELLRLHPDHREAALSLAFMLREQGRYDAAAQTMITSARARAGTAAETLATLGFLRECGAFEAAHELAEHACTRWPESAELAAAAGEFALVLGHFEPAQTHLRSALQRDRRKASSWLRLSHCRRFTTRDDADVQRFEAAWHDNALDAQARICAGFALGKALDDLTDYAGAANVLREANALARRQAPWDMHAWDEFVAQQVTAPAITAGSDANFAPVFIIGLPRTGTTLAATLLARDPQLRDRGELNWIGAMHAHLSAQQALHDAQALEITASLVATHMRRDDAPAHWYLDKNPLNFRYLGLIAALFPRAKIVHCRRDARDTALSLWMQHFDGPEMNFAYDFASIVAFARGYERLLAHWRDTLTLPIFELRYEQLVSTPDETLQELTHFIGCTSATSAGSSRAAIATASVWQARQPIHTHSIARWEHYAPHLPEMADLL